LNECLDAIDKDLWFNALTALSPKPLPTLHTFPTISLPKQHCTWR
jgi:hypothetical protein